MKDFEIWTSNPWFCGFVKVTTGDVLNCLLFRLRRERFGEVEWRAGETQAVDDGLEPVAIAASSQATSAEENGRHRFANRSPTAGPSSAVEDDGRHSASNSTEDASFECFVQNYEALDSSPAETSTSRPSPPVTRSASKRSKNSDDVGAAKSKRRKKWNEMTLLHLIGLNTSSYLSRWL